MKTKSKTKSTTGLLLPLFEKLKACPSRENRITEKMLLETWGGFKQQLDVEHGDELTPAVMAGLVLHDKEQFAPLLNETQHAQLAALGSIALERYEELAHPPNPLGKTLAASLKENI